MRYDGVADRVRASDPASCRLAGSAPRRTSYGHGRVVERWRPDDERPEVLSERLEWRPDVEHAALTIDLVEFFAEVVGE
jgi:hypothetical protein